MSDSAIAQASFTIIQTVATPTITPDGGMIDDVDTITLTTTTDGATIHYTTNGNDPTDASTDLQRSFHSAADATVKAFAVKSGLNDSAMASATFTVTQTRVTTPIISPNGGTINDNDAITITTTTAGATIHYTTDGNDPTDASPIYSTPFSLSTPMPPSRPSQSKAG